MIKSTLLCRVMITIIILRLGFLNTLVGLFMTNVNGRVELLVATRRRAFYRAFLAN